MILNLNVFLIFRILPKKKVSFANDYKTVNLKELNTPPLVFILGIRFHPLFLHIEKGWGFLDLLQESQYSPEADL